jgi:hypothetical protein
VSFAHQGPRFIRSAPVSNRPKFSGRCRLIVDVPQHRIAPFEIILCSFSLTSVVVVDLKPIGWVYRNYVNCATKQFEMLTKQASDLTTLGQQFVAFLSL